MTYFYPRPPRGGRLRSLREHLPQRQFLSTPSARRATRSPPAYPDGCNRISIHALREEGDPIFVKELCTAQAISIHALREEGDQSHPIRLSGCPYFYPRPPRGGRPSASPTSSSTSYFYPRPPRGGRPLSMCRCPTASDFYPRPPRGGRHGCPERGLQGA